MIRGVTAVVKRPVDGAKDRFGNATKEYTDELVNDVLVSPSVTDNTDEPGESRYEGDSVTIQLHFPKTYNDSLRDCLVFLPKPWFGPYVVQGDPVPYIDVNTPTRWHMPVKAVRARG